MSHIGYGFAWIGHFIFEKNKPATFKHPIYSVCVFFSIISSLTRKLSCENFLPSRETNENEGHTIMHKRTIHLTNYSLPSYFARFNS